MISQRHEYFQTVGRLKEAGQQDIANILLDSFRQISKTITGIIESVNSTYTALLAHATAENVLNREHFELTKELAKMRKIITLLVDSLDDPADLEFDEDLWEAAQIWRLYKDVYNVEQLAVLAV